MLAMGDQLQPLSEVLADADRKLRAGAPAASRVTPTGFTPLDTHLGGGLRSGELALLGGPPGLGKTTMALQMLRNVVTAGGVGVYFSFQHDASTLLERLVAIEAGVRTGVDGLQLRQVRAALENLDGASGTLADRLSTTPGGVDAVRGVEGYAHRLLIHRSGGGGTGLETMGQLVEQTVGQADGPVLVVVDYLQKVAVSGATRSDQDRVAVVAQGLKELALGLDVPVLAVVASDREGITGGRRMRLHHLLGAADLAYEADVVLVINDKYDVVARHHLVFDVGNAERFRSFAVVTLEKNRGGLDHIDLEFRKRFEQGRFDDEGVPVTEQLVDERVFVE
jgi:replicative DNA helicase